MVGSTPPSSPIREPLCAAQAFNTPQVHPTQALADKSRANSAHTSGVLVGLVDGSVRMVTGGVTQPTWQSALMPADGIPLGSDW